MHVGDIEGQLERMFVNVEELFSAQGMTLGDLVTGIMYLKDPSYYSIFQRVARRHGLPAAVPLAVVIADICRPTGLCEIEGMAVRARWGPRRGRPVISSPSSARTPQG